MGRGTPRPTAQAEVKNEPVVDEQATAPAAPVEGEAQPEVAGAEVEGEATNAPAAPGEPNEVPTDLGGGLIVDLIEDDENDKNDAAPESSPESAEAEAQRAAALANLAAGGDVDGDGDGGADGVLAEPELPTLTGEVHRWGGDTVALVISDRFNAIFDGNHQTARKGDAVVISAADAERGVRIGCLHAETHAVAELDEEQRAELGL